jgi:hypothetical protein
VFCEQTELNVVAGCYSSAPHGPFLLFPSRPPYAALLESPPDTPSKNRCNTVRYGRREEWLPTNGGRSFHFDPLLHMPRLVASFDTRRSRSTLDSPSSAQTTTVHPIPGPSPLHRWHQEGSAFRSSLAAVRPFFIQEITEVRDTPNVRSSPRKLLRSS